MKPARLGTPDNIALGCGPDPYSANKLKGSEPGLVLNTRENQKALKTEAFKIPRLSFTAFRLRYASVDQLSKLSKTVFLGTIPFCYQNSGTDSLLKKLSRASKRNGMFKTSPEGRSERDSQPTDSIDFIDFSQSALKTFYNTILSQETFQRTLLNTVVQGEDLLQDELRRRLDNNDACSQNQQKHHRLDGQEITANSLSTSDGISICMTSGGTKISRLYHDEKHKISDTKEQVSDILDLMTTLSIELTDFSSLNQYIPQFSAEDPTMATSDIVENEPASQRRKGVIKKRSISSDTTKNKFLSKKQLLNGPHLEFVYPTPENDAMQEKLEREQIFTERSSTKVVEKLKCLASDSKNRRNRLKVRLLDRIRAFPSGEIVRVDKMLVLVVFAPHKFDIMTFDELSDVSVNVEEHWLEYFVVLRRGEDEDELLLAQLYKAGRDRNFNKPPSFSFKIRPDLRIGFYSTLDKSISVIDPMDTGTRLFILSARFYSQSIKWIYLIKGCLDEQFSPQLKVRVDKLGCTFRVDLPSKLIREALKPKSSQSILAKENGYAPFRDSLHQYVYKFTKKWSNRLILSGTLNETPVNPNCWLSYKFNDYAEWVPNSDSSLLVYSQLFAKNSPLDLLCIHEQNLTTVNGSLEGFLGHFDKTKKLILSNLKSTYKLRYFMTSENLLFISRFSFPPSKHNLAEEDNNNLESNLESKFEYNVFDLDANGHLPWLNSSDFNRKDFVALSEYSRKVQQIISADYVIDLCTIRNVRSLPSVCVPSKSHLAHFELWHSLKTPPLDSELVETSFEIEFEKGATLSLLASSSSVRDEWVGRLTDLARFWGKTKHLETAMALEVRSLNQEVARTDDGKDVKATFDYRGLIQNTRFKTINDSLSKSAQAMSTEVLCSGFLYYKPKHLSSFTRRFAILCPGFMILFSTTKRTNSYIASNSCYHKVIAITISDCYIHTERLTQSFTSQLVSTNANQGILPRIYPDGWKSSEENTRVRFTLWCGRKRTFRPHLHSKVAKKLHNDSLELSDMVKLLSFRGREYTFQARSRHEHEKWVYNILEEINRLAYD